MHGLTSYFTFINIIWCKYERKLQIYKNTNLASLPTLLIFVFVKKTNSRLASFHLAAHLCGASRQDLPFVMSLYRCWGTLSCSADQGSISHPPGLVPIWRQFVYRLLWCVSWDSPRLPSHPSNPVRGMLWYQGMSLSYHNLRSENNCWDASSLRLVVALYTTNLYVCIQL